jgi:integrase
MARQPQLRKKKVGKSVYWFTKAGGDTYFGNVEDVPYTDARRLFRQHITSLADAARDGKRKVLTAGEMMDLFLDWVQAHRSDRSYGTRRTHCSRFGAFMVGGTKVADLPADKVKGADLEAWLAQLADKGHSAQTRRHAQTSIKHAWNWATKHPSPTPYLPPTFRPFSSVERVYVAPKTLREDDLVTDDEIRGLFAAAEIDLDTFHRFGPKVPRPADQNPYRAFADMLRCYYWTGARTDELAQCRVADVLFRTSQVILGKHKRSKTQRTPTVRHITLNPEALAIFERHCARKGPADHVFLNSDNKPFHRRSLPERFNRVKEVAAKQGLGIVREEVTIYSFRDLWISEALMAGNDIATVARMAGTSIAMIERVYGHFRNQHLQDAQARVDELRRQRGR